MAQSNYITPKVQIALRDYLRGALASSDIPDEQIVAGMHKPQIEPVEDPDVPLPRVVCVCQTATVSAGDSTGICWVATASVEIRTNADDYTEEQHHAMAESVVDLICVEGISQLLTDALTDFTAFGVMFRSQSWDLRDRSWVAVLVFDVMCEGADVA